MSTTGQLLHIGIMGAPMDVGGLVGAVPTTRQLPDRGAPASSKSLGNREVPRDGEGVLIGVVDTGAGANSWLDGGYLAAPGDFEKIMKNCSGTRPYQAGHGTFVTGLILKQAPAAGVWVERALDPSGSGDNAVIAQAARTLVRRGVHILNLSLGAFDQYEQELQSLVDELLEMNPHLVIVAAAGNLAVETDSSSRYAAAAGLARPSEPTPFFPAALPKVVSVGSTRAPEGLAPSQEWAEWSNRGDWIDFAACGDQVLSSYIDDIPLHQHQESTAEVAGRRFAEWSGTSFAAAIVSGAIAAKMTEHEDRQSAREAVAELRGSGFRTHDDGGPGGSVPIVTSRRWRWPPIPGSAD